MHYPFLALGLSLSLSLSSTEERMINICYLQAVCPEPRKSDCYHLAVNLMDRYLGYRTPKIEELPAIVCACTMISLKLRRATKECLSYHQLRCCFHSISEQNIRVSWCVVRVVMLLSPVRLLYTLSHVAYGAGPLFV